MVMEQLNVNSIKEQLMKSCIINGMIKPLDEIEHMGITEFGIQSKLNMPLKLYKYYSNIDEMNADGNIVNYSKQSLMNNTVYLQTPTKFDDIYDSDITLDYNTYERLRVMEYCKRCGVKVNDAWTNQEAGDALVKSLWPFYIQNNLEKAFSIAPKNELERLSNQEFYLSILVECKSSRDFGEAVSRAIVKEHHEYSEYLKDVFRITCFTTTPYSQLMWGGSYADQHRGFCVEYTVLPQEKAYQDIYYNIFPVVYCKVRPDVTKRIVDAKDKIPTDNLLWDIYFHGVLRKSIDWAYQYEWRLLLPFGKNRDDYNIEFFPITKVFLGNRMSAQNRKAIIEICKKRGIPYVGVNRNPGFFEMQDCNVLCENCEKIIQCE